MNKTKMLLSAVVCGFSLGAQSAARAGDVTLTLHENGDGLYNSTPISGTPISGGGVLFTLPGVNFIAGAYWIYQGPTFSLSTVSEIVVFGPIGFPGSGTSQIEFYSNPFGGADNSLADTQQFYTVSGLVNTQERVQMYLPQPVTNYVPYSEGAVYPGFVDSNNGNTSLNFVPSGYVRNSGFSDGTTTGWVSSGPGTAAITDATTDPKVQLTGSLVDFEQAVDPSAATPFLSFDLDLLSTGTLTVSLGGVVLGTFTDTIADPVHETLAVPSNLLGTSNDLLVFEYSGGGHTAVLDNIAFSAPEPTSLALFAICAMGLCVKRKR